MSVSPSFLTLVLEQLNRAVPPVRSKRMFGGVGLYARDTFFALIADDVVYVKADAISREEFTSKGLPQFRPFGADGMAMEYYALPPDALEDVDALREWTEKGIGAALRAKRNPPKKKGRG